MSASLKWSMPAGAAILAAAAVVVHFGVRGMDLTEVSARLPDPDRLEELSYFLTPVAQDGGSGAGPPPYVADDPFDAPASLVLQPPQPSEAPAAEVRLDVSAIFVSEGRRVAIVNQRTVAPGDPLPGGAVVESIESDRVVVVEPTGRRRVLRF